MNTSSGDVKTTKAQAASPKTKGPSAKPKGLSTKPKGQRTAERILDAAEKLFASKGYKGTSLREIARNAHLQQPGIYKHFDSKQDLYASVLDRALSPMIEAMQKHLADDKGLEAYAQLLEQMTDLLAQHPGMAALFQQALLVDDRSADHQPITEWLERLLVQGKDTIAPLGGASCEEQAIQIIATFNLVTGYFLSQRIFETLAEGRVTDPANIDRQKQLLRRIAAAWHTP